MSDELIVFIREGFFNHEQIDESLLQVSLVYKILYVQPLQIFETLSSWSLSLFASRWRAIGTSSEDLITNFLDILPLLLLPDYERRITTSLIQQSNHSDTILISIFALSNKIGVLLSFVLHLIILNLQRIAISIITTFIPYDEIKDLVYFLRLFNLMTTMPLTPKEVRIKMVLR